MKKQTITIDHVYKYEVQGILEGGMGYVLLLSLQESLGIPTLSDVVLDHSKILQDHFRYPYRKQLAGKTVKEERAMQSFARECNVWLGFQQSGIVPLLKVVKIGDAILALMPRYHGNLRTAMKDNVFSAAQIMQSLYEPISGLSSLYERHSLVHQDIKPENLLYEYYGGRLSLFLSDWGIANVKSGLLAQDTSGYSKFAMKTMGGFGTVPYMAPERFASYVSDIRADIFSLGILFFEVLTRTWPYDSNRPIAEQIITGEYFERALSILSGFPDQTASNLILLMIHPSEHKRLQEYRQILKFIKSL